MNLSDINIKSPLFSGSQFLNYNQGYIYNKVYIYIYIHVTYSVETKPQTKKTYDNLFQTAFQQMQVTENT